MHITNHFFLKHIQTSIEFGTSSPLFSETERCDGARDLFGSQILVTTGGFELQISSIQSRYLALQAIRPNRLGRFRLPEFATLRQEKLIYVEILQL